MPRIPKPYKKGSWFCTSAGGIPHQKLCKFSEGEKAAELELMRLLVEKDNAERAGVVTPTPGRGIPLVIKPEALQPASALASQVYDDFLAAKKVENEDSTYIGYRDCLEDFFQRFAKRPIASITYEDGLRFKDWLRREKQFTRGNQHKQGLSPARVNKVLRVCKILFNWAMKPSRRHKYGLQMNPWVEIKFYVEKPRERLIADDEFKHMLANCTDGSVRGGKRDFQEQLTVLRNTTMRPGELRKLQWDYVQLDGNRIVFPPQVIKTKKRREVVLIDVVKRVLQDRRQRALDRGLSLTGYVFPLPVKHEGKRTVFEAGERMQKTDGFAQRFRRLVERCVKKGLVRKEVAGERIVPYSTRHTRITELFVQGNEHHVVMFDAGHVVPATTERYKHLAGSWVADQIRQRSQRAEGTSSPDAG